MKILLDVDGVIADFYGAVSQVLWGFRNGWPNAIRPDGVPWQPEDCRQYNIQQALGLNDNLWQATCERIDRPGFAHHCIGPYPGAVDVVEKLSRLGEVFFITKPWSTSRTWAYDREQWLIDHFQHVINVHERVISTGVKHLVRGDVFIEDNPDTLREHEKYHNDKKIKHFLVAREYNHHDGCFPRGRLENIVEFLAKKRESK